MEVKFLKVDIGMAVKHGADVALFYAYLKFVGRKIRKDEHGYFCFDANYVCRGLGWGRTKFKYVRTQAVRYHLIDYLPGSNQNEKPRYRII